MKITLTIILTVALLFLTVYFAGGGHGSYTPAKVIYPYTMLIAGFKSEIGIIVIILAIAQIPAYALILIKKPNWKYYLLGVHIIAVILALTINNDIF